VGPREPEIAIEHSDTGESNETSESDGEDQNGSSGTDDPSANEHETESEEEDDAVPVIDRAALQAAVEARLRFNAAQSASSSSIAHTLKRDDRSLRARCLPFVSSNTIFEPYNILIANTIHA
jgi:hypothetical protein